MKPCTKNRKAITWLAIDALDAEATRLLREHLKNCGGCRHAFEEVSLVARTLDAAGPQEDLAPADALHQRVTKSLRALKRQPRDATAIPLLGKLLAGRLAIPAFALLAAAIILTALLQHPAGLSPTTRSSQTGAPSQTPRSAPPTVAHYRSVANESLDQFDELVTRQARQNLPPAPLFNIASARTASLD